MPTPFPSSDPALTRCVSAAHTTTVTSNSEWRCTSCNKLLGIRRGKRMHLRFTRGHEYLVGFPVQATCLGCGTLNHADAAY